MLARRGAGKDTYSIHYTYDDDVDDRCIDVRADTQGGVHVQMVKDGGPIHERVGWLYW
jgi:hypothetical protein